MLFYPMVNPSVVSVLVDKPGVGFLLTMYFFNRVRHHSSSLFISLSYKPLGMNDC
jgi:hypothetical protein